MGLLTFVLLFTTFCLIIWGAARPYEPEVIVKLRDLVHGQLKLEANLHLEQLMEYLFVPQ
jgi:hypothetical protein